MSCTPEALASYTRDRSAYGPANITEATRQFEQRLRGVLARINARIREAIDENDLFGLRDEALVDDVPNDVFDFPTDQAKVSGFLRWLRNQLDNHFLEVVGEDRNQFLRMAYAAGLREANSDLEELDVAFTRPDVDDVLSRPIHRTALQTLYARTYSNLVSVRDDTAQAVRDELITGFREGQNPRDIARSLTGRVDSIGKHRATLIARSETINAHTESYLNRTEELQRDADVDVGVSHSEWLTAQDDDVCPICRPLNGRTFTIEEMRNQSFEIGSQVFQLRPPAHVNCRCTLTVQVGFDRENLAPLSERLPSEDEVRALQND